MEDEDEAVEEGREPDGVGVVGVALRVVEEEPELVDLEEADAANSGHEAHAEVEEVQWEQAAPHSLFTSAPGGREAYLRQST